MSTTAKAVGEVRSVPVRWARDINDGTADEQPELVEDLLTAGGMSCMYGPSNSGKSYFALHLSFALAEGRPFLGKRVHRGTVIYIAGEGASSIRQRLRAFRRRHGLALARFCLVEKGLNLLDGSADVPALIEVIDEVQRKSREPVALVVIDTLARAMAGADENSTRDMGRLVAAGDRVRESTGAHVLYVHHSGKDALAGARGSSALRAALDSEIEVTVDKSTKLHMLEVTKQRDLATVGLRLAARFESVDLGVNQWGKPITACIVEKADEAVAFARKAKQLTGVPKLAFDAIQAAIMLHGRHPEVLNCRESATGVTLDQARKEFDRVAGQIDSKHRASRFSGAVTSLKNSGRVHGADDWVWLPNAAGAPNYRVSKDTLGDFGAAPSTDEHRNRDFGDLGDHDAKAAAISITHPSARSSSPVVSDCPPKDGSRRGLTENDGPRSDSGHGAFHPTQVASALTAQGTVQGDRHG